jgi:predicted RNase H-like HicB family nuclease
MKMRGFSVAVFPEADSFSAWCPDLDVASQGDSMNKALANLKEALELHLECMTPSEMKEIRGRQGTKLITTLEIPVTN